MILELQFTFPAVTINNELQINLDFWLTFDISLEHGFEMAKLIDYSKDQGEQYLLASKFNLRYDLLFCHFRMLVEGMVCSDVYVVAKWTPHYRHLNKSENLLGKIRKILQPEWIVEQSATWNGDYEVKFREVLTKRGYGFAFNMIQESNMFTEKLEVCKVKVVPKQFLCF
jgi:hypothetical protein